MSLDQRDCHPNPQTTHIEATESASDAVISAVAAASGLEPVPGRTGDCLDPLYAAVDPDALDRLFRPDALGRVTFHYHGYEVTVDSDNRVMLDPIPEQTV